MKVPIEVEETGEGFRASIPGMSLLEGRGETETEAVDELIDWASLFLECKEPDMLEFEIVGRVRSIPGAS